jgi:hypothetical protein
VQKISNGIHDDDNTVKFRAAMWVKLGESEPLQLRHFVWIGTGFVIPDDDKRMYDYIATVQLQEIGFVGHLFEWWPLSR